MKNFVISFFAFSLVFFAFCKNNSDSQDSQSGIDIHPDSLYVAIRTDFLAGRAASFKFKELYDSSFIYIRDIKMATQRQPEGKRERLLALTNESIKFQFAFRDHYSYTDNLDSLSTQLKEDRIKNADAQKEYRTVKADMLNAESKMKLEFEHMLAIEDTLHQEFPDIKATVVRD